MFNIAQIKKQAARMEQQMKEIQAQLAIRTVDATSGGGAVKVTAKCDGSLAAIRRKGIPTYIFSNTNDLAVEHIQRAFPFFANFDGYIYSHEVGAMKPAAKIYEALEKMSGKRGADIVYLDDRPENIAAGAARGWQTILQTEPAKSRMALEKLGVV